MHYRTDYCAAQLNEAPQVLHIGDLRLHYQAYACRSHDTRPPVLLLGGAFQSFRSFAAEVSELLGEHPVILLDLPSQGGNLQLVPDLNLEQLADLIAAFAEELDLPPLMPIGLSYGSALAALFAARHPERCARVLLAGITAFGRPGARLLLQEGLALLAEISHWFTPQYPTLEYAGMALAVLALALNALVWGLSWWPLRQLDADGLHPLWATACVFTLATVVLTLSPEPDVAAQWNDRRLFELAVGPVQPLVTARRVHHAPRPVDPSPRQRQLDEASVMREALSDDFDVETLLHTDEALSYRRPGRQPNEVGVIAGCSSLRYMSVVRRAMSYLAYISCTYWHRSRRPIFS